TAYIYYDKGSLAGLLLDILIRDASDNRGSLDAVLRDLYAREYKRGSGFTEQEFWSTVQRVAGRSLADFERRYIDGREPFPYERVLPLAGLRASEVRAPRLGITTEPDGDSVRITAVQPGSAAASAGVRAGDVLLALGTLVVSDQNFGAAYRARYAQAAEGTALPIRVRRGGETLTLPGVIRYAVAGITITVDPAASQRALRLRDGILLGRSN
nr:PDZ domain-containing protein [Gemmatimonadaceae bacterium]